MKTLELPLVNGFDDLASFAVTKIAEVPWKKDFPYCPAVTLHIAHTADALLLQYDVEEDNVKAVCVSSNGPVWEDSCVEFFVKTPGSPFYFNFETNCIGTGLASKRLSRESCRHFSPVMMEQVKRKSSLPHTQIDTGKGKWTLELTVPFKLLDCGERPEKLLANFYKCGDKTAQTHFVAWAPIDNPKPNFHLPEFFGQLTLLW